MNHRPNQQELHCAPCDRAFGNQGDFNAHLKSHVKCSEEGCRFEASGERFFCFLLSSVSMKAIVVFNLYDKTPK